MRVPTVNGRLASFDVFSSLLPPTYHRLLRLFYSREASHGTIKLG